MTKRRLFALAGLLAVLGMGLMVRDMMWEPATPEAECAPPDGPTSGFWDTEKNCLISIESWAQIRPTRRCCTDVLDPGPAWDNIGGVVLFVGGLGVAGVAALRKPKTAPNTPDSQPEPDKAAPGGGGSAS